MERMGKMVAHLIKENIINMMDIFQRTLRDLPQTGGNRMEGYKSRIIELKRKNAISNMCKEWRKESINIEIDDFLKVQETLQLQNNIMRKLEEMDTNNTFIISQAEDFIIEFYQILLSKIDKDQVYVFFVGQSNEIGALLLKGNVILEKYSYIIKYSELFYKGCNIFFCNLNMRNGICFWRGEYDKRIYIW